jgi:hypothetical protein
MKPINLRIGKAAQILMIPLIAFGGLKPSPGRSRLAGA